MLPYPQQNIPFLIQIFRSVAIQLIHLLQQLLGCLLVGIDFGEESCFKIEEGENVVIQQLCIIYQFLCSPDLFWLAFLLEIALGNFKRRGCDIPILKYRDPGLFGFEELRHLSISYENKLNKLINHWGAQMLRRSTDFQRSKRRLNSISTSIKQSQEPMSTQRHQIQLFEQILAKFIINLPQLQIEDSNRLSFQAEKAFYYYLDHVLCTINPQNWEKQRIQFLTKLAQYAPSSIRFDPRKLAMKIQENKPVCGALVFNKDESKILVIRVRNKLGFPKGKWNQHQSASQCAAREVQEETGIYIHNRIDPDIEIQFESHGSSTRFFVARGISQEDRLRKDVKEIDDIFWMRVQDIEPNKWKLAQKSRVAWQHFQKLTKKSLTNVSLFEQFMQRYKSPSRSLTQLNQNPFLSFKLERQPLRRALLAGLDSE